MSKSPWRKSSASSGQDCVEVAFEHGVVQVRDSKDPEGAVLRFGQSEWDAFLAGVHRGESDSA